LTAVADQEPDRVHWERVAREWTAWARKPGHDAFWSYRAALAEFVGPGSGEALDVGCGEGRVSRELKALGWRVTATDAVAAMVAAAREIDSADAYARSRRRRRSPSPTAASLSSSPTTC
jgi:2-polyprenyl-3-methyl-5-hydroxy-6-metoxy-1,4-benzoquinol methylase